MIDEYRRKIIWIALLSGLGLAGWAGALPDEAPLNWGGRAVHPAVVNPVGGLGEDVLSLRGEWEFSQPKRDLPNRNGVWGNFNCQQTWGASRTIRVPGCWEAQGVGEPGPSECWDPKWDCNDKPIRHKYMGEGWYRKTVTIPANWQGRRIWLKIGGVKAVAWFWVNDQQVAHVANYCATEKYEITDLVTPGKSAKIVVDVDNRKPSRKGLMSAMHRWGGIYRDIELEATPQTFIDDAWVRGDFDNRMARVNVVLAKGAGAPNLKVRATIDGASVESALDANFVQTTNLVVNVPLRQFRPWSPESPNLYWAKIELVQNDLVVQTRRERFGVRKFEVRGRDFYLNDKPFYVRGFGDDCVYPLTGMSPADRAYHREHLQKAKAAGFNFVRLHTHCELPEYFEAADEVGVLIQAELPYYSDVPCEGFAFDPVRDVTELWRNYRRYPSFAVYSMGNEGSFGPVLDRRLHAYIKQMDPDRLKINQDSNVPKLNPPDSADYCGGPVTFWPRGSFDPKRPFVTHEYLNLCVKLDSRDEGAYTGVWQPPSTRAARAAWLAKFGLDLAWGDRLQDAQHALQSVWQKRGVEAARSDPYCRGYSFWTAVDVVVWNPDSQSFTSQGLLDPFWNEKRHGTTLQQFAAFNAPDCVLADFHPNRHVFTSGEKMRTDILFAHYGETSHVADAAKWRLVTGTRVLAEGRVAVGSIERGPARKVAACDVTLPEVTTAQEARFEVSLGEVRNGWDVWLFPKRVKRDGAQICIDRAFLPKLASRYANLVAPESAAQAKVVIAPAHSPLVQAALARGQRVITLDGTDGPANVSLGWWWMGNQVGTAMRDHAALKNVPHKGVLSPLFFRILKQGVKLPQAISAEDMIVVGEGGSACFLYLAERKVGAARLLEAHGLDVLSDTPEGMALLDGFIDDLLAK